MGGKRGMRRHVSASAQARGMGHAGSRGARAESVERYVGTRAAAVRGWAQTARWARAGRRERDRLRLCKIDPFAATTATSTATSHSGSRR